MEEGTKPTLLTVIPVQSEAVKATEENSDSETDSDSSTDKDDEADPPSVLDSLSRWSSKTWSWQKAYSNAWSPQTARPMPQMLPHGREVTASRWGITRQQVVDLYESCLQDATLDEHDNVTQFVHKCVIPPTQGSRMGLALLLNQNAPKEVNLMVSHAWVENACRFFDDFLKHTLDHEIAYICFLSNYQGTPEEIDAQLGNNIHYSPFTEVICSPACSRMLVIPNEELFSTGHGLYSRLWCDWEILCAANAGLPIDILPERSTKGHLLGTETISSRQARCGNPLMPPNKDEKLIRNAIQDMPPRTSRFQALGLFVVAICSVLGAEVGLSIGISYPLWISGYMCGFIVGCAFTKFLGCIRTQDCYEDFRKRDGYQVLDNVIHAAAKGWYSTNRITFEKDLPSVCRYFITFAILDGVVRIAWSVAKTGYPLGRGLGIGWMQSGIVEGTGVGVIIWSTCHINKMGTWTGAFTLRPSHHRAYGALVMVCVLAGGYAGIRNYTEDGASRGCMLGWMFGLWLVSMCHAKWKHALGIFWMFLVMGDAIRASPYLWREISIIILGFGGVWLEPDWKNRERVGLTVVFVIAIVGLRWLMLKREEAVTRVFAPYDFDFKELLWFVVPGADPFWKAPTWPAMTTALPPASEAISPT